MRSSIIFALLLAGCAGTDRAPGPPAGGGCAEGDVRVCNASVPGPVEIARGQQACRDGRWGDCAPINDGGIDGD